ncbi:MAG TPA: AraC family transcriptional regulator [Steroidobacteraceae bacterium]|nr:AraC family transcriptional regulator [Steroidobacteraceae bacterium]
MTPTRQTDYLKRIDRVIAAVAASLEEERPLPSTAALAAVANFSPFHFMRVYRALSGESLGSTIQRLRLTRAAHLLAESSARVGDIAGRAGFETPQSFARAFRQHFGLSPSEARSALAETRAPAPPAPEEAAISIDVVTLAPFRVVVLRNRGAYSKLDEAYGRLFAWMAARGALEAIEGLWGIPHHDRRDTPDEESLFDCCLATSAPVDAAEGVTLREIEGGQFLAHLHVGAYAQLDDSHDALLRALLMSGQWQLREAPILHQYLDDPENTPEAQLRTRIYLPMEGATGTCS